MASSHRLLWVRYNFRRKPTHRRLWIMLRTRLTRLAMSVATIALLSSGLISAHAQTQPLEIKFYYPTAVNAPIDKVMDDFATQFNAANPDIKVTPVYAGGYTDIYKAIDTQIKGGGSGPDVAILLSTDLYSLIDNDYIVPLDSFIKGSKEADTYLKDFFP